MASTLYSTCTLSSPLLPRGTSHPHPTIKSPTKIGVGSRPVSSRNSSFWSGNPNLGPGVFGGVGAATGLRYIKDRPTRSRITVMSLYTPELYINSNGELEEADLIDILSRDGIISLHEYINAGVSARLMFTLLYMDTIPQPKKRFLLLIDCPGGNLQAGMALYDTLCSLQTPLYTLNMGYAFDVGAYILAAGKKGKRASFPKSTIRLMPLEAKNCGKADHVLNETTELVRIRDHLQAEFAKNTGQPVEKAGPLVRSAHKVFLDAPYVKREIELVCLVGRMIVLRDRMVILVFSLGRHGLLLGRL